MKISSLFKPLSFLPALALMYMIYSFSSQPADSSSSTSFYVSRKIVQVVDIVSSRNWEDWEIDQHAQQIHGIVRKGAHITEYFLLAIAISFPLYVYGVRGILLMLLAGGICVAYACGDEYHQSLVDGRAASSRDVMIDSIGIFFGVILTRLIGWSGRMAITGPAYERRQKKMQQELDAREESLRRREAALRREESRYRQARRPARRDGAAGRPAQGRPQGTPQQGRPVQGRAQGMSQQGRPAQGRPQGMSQQGRPAQEMPYGKERMPGAGAPAGEDAMGRTRVIGTRQEVDDRTRVYLSEEEMRRRDEAYRRQVYERRKVQSPQLGEDSTSDQLSEDLPLSGLFRRKDKSSQK